MLTNTLYVPSELYNEFRRHDHLISDPTNSFSLKDLSVILFLD